MATNTLNTRVVICSKTTSQWASTTTVPLKGEICIEWISEDSNTLPKMKVGNGTDVYADLPYATFTEKEIKAFISQAAFDLQPATASALGGVKIGSNVNVAADGTISIPAASATSATAGTAGVMSVADKNKLNNIAAGAEVNQNAFSNVKVGNTTVAADAKTDTLELVAGTNITLTPDATNDKVTIAATDTTYGNATTSTHGLMTAADKTKLNGIESGADATDFIVQGTDDSDVYHITNGATVKLNNSSVTLDGTSAVFTIDSASTSQKGIVQLTDSTSSTSTTTAATPSAVKSAYDLANAAMPKSGGTFTGAVTLNADPTTNLGAATKQYVDTQITSKIAASDALVYRGTLGTGGTVTALPTSGVVKGDCYKVLVAATYAEQAAKVGDLYIALNSGSVAATAANWTLIPSGNENETFLKYSTSTTNLTTTAQSGTITLAEGAVKQVDTSLTSGTTSTKLPTSKAVVEYVAGATVTKANSVPSHNFSITGGATASAVAYDATNDVALNVTSLDAMKLTKASSDVLIIDGNFS